MGESEDENYVSNNRLRTISTTTSDSVFPLYFCHMCISATGGNDASTFPNQLDCPPANWENSVSALVFPCWNTTNEKFKRGILSKGSFSKYTSVKKSWKNKETSVRAERGYIYRYTVERYSYRTLYTFTFQFSVEERLLDFSLYPDGV